MASNQQNLKPGFNNFTTESQEDIAIGKELLFRKCDEVPIFSSCCLKVLAHYGGFRILDDGLEPLIECTDCTMQMKLNISPIDCRRKCNNFNCDFIIWNPILSNYKNSSNNSRGAGIVTDQSNTQRKPFEPNDLCDIHQYKELLESCQDMIAIIIQQSKLLGDYKSELNQKHEELQEKISELTSKTDEYIKLDNEFKKYEKSVLPRSMKHLEENEKLEDENQKKEKEKQEFKKLCAELETSCQKHQNQVEKMTEKIKHLQLRIETVESEKKDVEEKYKDILAQTNNDYEAYNIIEKAKNPVMTQEVPKIQQETQNSLPSNQLAQGNKLGMEQPKPLAEKQNSLPSNQPAQGNKPGMEQSKPKAEKQERASPPSNQTTKPPAPQGKPNKKGGKKK